MALLYIGHSGDLNRRVNINHRRGNIDNSVLRLDIHRSRFEANGLPLNEDSISIFIEGGRWKCLLCNHEEDFRNYLIELLHPEFGNGGAWNGNLKEAFERHLAELIEMSLICHNECKDIPAGSGVNLFFHD